MALKRMPSTLFAHGLVDERDQPQAPSTTLRRTDGRLDKTCYM